MQPISIKSMTFFMFSTFSKTQNYCCALVQFKKSAASVQVLHRSEITAITATIRPLTKVCTSIVALTTYSHFNVKLPALFLNLIAIRSAVKNKSACREKLLKQ